MALENKVAKNALWIIGGKVIQALIAVVVSALTTRYLGPENKGLLDYAASLTSFFTPLMYLGVSNTIVNELKTSRDEGKVMGTGLVMTLVSSFLCIIGVISFVSIANRGEQDTFIVCSLYSILLVFNSIDLIQYWFQSHLLSKYTSIATLIGYVIFSLYKIILLSTGQNVYWFAVSAAIEYAVIGLLLHLVYRKMNGPKLLFSFDLMKEMLRRSKYYILSGMMIMIFQQTDKIMIKLMLGNAAEGYYGVATALVGMTTFIFGAITDSMRPLILENRANGNMDEYKRNIGILSGMVTYLAIAQSVVLTIFGGLAVKILYGDAFMPAVTSLTIVVWYTIFSYWGGIRNIWVLAENKQKYLWRIDCSGALMNVVFNFLLIPKWGIEGAAIATLLTQIFTNVFMVLLTKPLREGLFIMTKGLHPKILSEVKNFVFAKKKNKEM